MKQVDIDYKVDPLLRDYAFDGIELFLPKIDKAIYVYLKLCRALQYDSRYFVVDYEIDSRKREYVNNINLFYNNKTTCFAFTIIYTKLLRELGIDAEYWDGTSPETPNIKTHHAVTIFNCDGYTIKADAVNGFFFNDLFFVKNNFSPKSFECINLEDNDKKTKEIIQKINKVSSNIFFHDKYSKINWEKYYKKLRLLYGPYDIEKPVAPRDFISGFAGAFEDICETPYSDMERISAMIYFVKDNYQNYLESKQISISYVKNCETGKPALVCVLGRDNIKVDSNFSKLHNKYLILDDPMEKRFYTAKQVQRMFDKKKYEYIYTIHERDDSSCIRFDLRIPHVFDEESPSNYPE